MNDEGPKVVVITGEEPISRRVALLCDAMTQAGIAFKRVYIHASTPTFGVDIDSVWMDDMVPTMTGGIDISRPSSFTLSWPVAISPKRRALIAQIERAKVRRDKNAVRDLTRQLETLRD